VAIVLVLLVHWLFPDFNLPYRWVAWTVLAFDAGYALWYYLLRKQLPYLIVALFTTIGVGFLYSVNFAFSKLEDHQRVRIEVLLGMKDDLKGAGYNVNQAKIAIGSGGLWGKGYLEGTQTKLSYVPEQETDFIFCTVGEEEGLWGCVLVLALYATLVIRLVYLAERQRTVFAQVYGYCVASIFIFHVLINVGMVIGLCPVIGIPLPFFSYGGSGLWSFTILLFIFLKLDALRVENY
jgi:rod shape determining protein RodA